MRNRFYVANGLATDSTVELAGEEFHHAIRVHRSAVNEEVELFDGKSHAFLGRIESITKASATIRVLEPMPARESPLHITLALALIQPDRYELVLQKATELGVARFQPLISERTETRPERIAGRLERWRKIILEATKQSGRATVPVLESPRDLDRILSEQSEKLMFDGETEPSPPPGAMSSAILLIGPEGGWSPRETERARQAGCHFQSLGPRRLRAETAAIAALTVVGARYGDLA